MRPGASADLGKSRNQLPNLFARPGNRGAGIDHVIGALALFGIGGLAISQVLWIVAVGQLGIAMSSLHINLTPFYVMVILLALGGTWNWLQAAGAAIVAVAVLIAQGLIPLGRR